MSFTLQCLKLMIKVTFYKKIVFKFKFEMQIIPIKQWLHETRIPTPQDNVWSLFLRWMMNLILSIFLELQVSCNYFQPRNGFYFFLNCTLLKYVNIIDFTIFLVVVIVMSQKHLHLNLKLHFFKFIKYKHNYIKIILDYIKVKTPIKIVIIR